MILPTAPGGAESADHRQRSAGRASIRLKLTLLIGGLLAAVTLGYSWAAYWQMRSSALAATSDRLDAIAGEWARFVATGEAAQVGAMRILAASGPVERAASRSGALDASDSLAAVRLLSAELPLGSQRLLVRIFGADGRPIVRIGAPRAWGDSLPLAPAARSSAARAIGDLRAVGDSTVYPLVCPIVVDGRVRGYLVSWQRTTIQPSPDQLNRLFGGPSIHVRVANRSGSVWSDFQKPIPALDVDLRTTGRLSTFRTMNGETALAAVTPVAGTPWSIVVESSNEELLAVGRHFVEGLAIIGLLAIVLGVLGAIALSASLVGPLSRLTDTVEAVARRDYTRSSGASRRRDEIGRLSQAFDVMVDRLQAAFAAHEASEQQQRRLFESIPLPCWVFDLETLRILAVNEAAVRRYGHSRAEFLAMTIADIRPAADVPAVRELVARNRATGGASESSWRHVKKDGTVIDVETWSRAVEFEGRAARIAVIHDVTERRRTAEAIQGLKERYLKLIREAPNGVTLALLDGRFIAVNPAFAEMLGYESEAELLATNARQFYADPEQRAGLVAKMSAGETVKRVEVQLRRKDGEIITTHLTGRIVRDAESGEDYIEAVTEDITEQRKVERQFQQAQRMEAVGQLAGGIAHDFNNLLTVIINYSELLYGDDSLTADQRDEAGSIRQAGQSAAALTRQLLILSRQQMVQPKVMQLNELVAGVGKLLKRLIGENIELETSLDAAAGLVKADPGQIEQVIVNLAVNARDAMPNGGKLLIESKNVTLSEPVFEQAMSYPAGPYVTLCVSDTGVGMDRQTQTRVFEPFFTTKGPGKGTGLGLATVYGIVKQSDGFISLYSEPGKGTSFKIYLPRLDATQQISEIESATARPGRGETILLVEDQADVRRIVSLMLRRLGYRVLVASDGDGALALVARNSSSIDLLVTDVVLPGVSGRVVADEVTRRLPGTKVLFVSGYTDDAVVRHGVLAAGIHYLEKPFTPDALASKVRSVLDSGSSLRPVTAVGNR
ncbi:MAG: PAS domain S-box protein [Gemmatimonadales bacterium]